MSTSAPPSNRPLHLWPLITGLVAGTATGLFFGEGARVLEPVADGFVKLLQMAVLPYITVSIVGSIGALDVAELRRLGARVALVLLALWTLALGFAFLMPLAFPPAARTPRSSARRSSSRRSRSAWSTCTFQRTPSSRSPTASCPAWCCSR